MTRQKSFKRLVRARMEKTGESYTAARASLALEHARLADAGEADRTRARWREHLTALKSQLERGDVDA